MFKKVVSILISVSVVLSAAVSVSAAKIGDVIGTVYNTDIVAYINNYAIPSYAANGTSVVVAEDLRNFGFDVVWDGVARTLTLSKNENTNPSEMQVFKEGRPGTKFSDLLYTDIKVYANGSLIPSYAINGYTMIPMEALTMCGECHWISEERALKLWVDSVHIREEKQIVDNVSDITPIVETMFNHLMNYDFKSAMSYTTNWEEEQSNLDEMISDIAYGISGEIPYDQAERLAKVMFAKMIEVNSYEILSVRKEGEDFAYDMKAVMASDEFPNSLGSLAEEAAYNLIDSGKINAYTSESKMVKLLIDETIRLINKCEVPVSETYLSVRVVKQDGKWVVVYGDEII